MAFVTAPWQLFALRALLGLFAGYGALTVSMAAESVPREKMASAMRLRPGGAAARSRHRARARRVSRAACRLAPRVPPGVGVLPISSRCCSLPSSIGEPRKPREARRAPQLEGRLPRARPDAGLHAPDGRRHPDEKYEIVDRSFGPILPLYVEHIGVPSARVSLVSGILFSRVGHLRGRGSSTRRWPVAALVRAHADWRGGACWQRRHCTDRPRALGVGALGVGIALSGVRDLGLARRRRIRPRAAYAAGRRAHATGFGVMTTASLTGLAASPGGGGIRQRHEPPHRLRAGCLIALLLLAWAVRTRMRDRPVTPHPAGGLGLRFPDQALAPVLVRAPLGHAGSGSRGSRFARRFFMKLDHLRWVRASPACVRKLQRTSLMASPGFPRCARGSDFSRLDAPEGAGAPVGPCGWLICCWLSRRR